MCIHWEAGRPVRIVQLLLSMMENVEYVIRVNCIEHMQYKLKTVTPVLKRFVTLPQEDYSVAIISKINMISGRITIPA